MRLRRIFTLFLPVVFCSSFSSHILLAQSVSGQKTLGPLNNLSGSFEALAERVGPAVVHVLASGYAAYPGGASTTSTLLSREYHTGSGVILDADGYIITNAHVVDGARRIQVVLPAPLEEQAKQQSILKSRGKVLGAQIMNVDRETDLAVLKVQEKGLPFLELGDSDAVRQGQLVFAFGSPLGLENSVTMGVVSSVARQLRSEDPMVYIQTDAPINPGNSGGPLVDTKGRVVGINTLIFSQSGGNEGIGFAAPSNIVRNVFEQIRATGRMRRGEIGVYAQTVTPTLASGLGLSQDWGAVLGDVFPGDPAARAGLEVGDVILALDGKVMENGRQFQVNLYQRAIGDQVTLEVLRGSERLTVQVPVIEREGGPERFADMVSPEKNLVSELGILGIEVNAEVARMLPGLRKRSGVVVAARAVDAPYWEGGLLPGDVVHAINGTPIRSMADLRTAVSGFKAYDPVVIQIERQGKLRFVAFEME